MSAALLVAALLLAGAGVAKAISPHDTARAFRRAGLPVGQGPHVVRAVAVMEIGVGLAGVAVGGWWAPAAVAASYACFALFLVVALGRGWSLSSCGCFGQADAPPTVGHVVVDTALALGAGIAAGEGRDSPLRQALVHPLWGTGLFALSLVTAGLAYLTLARLPQLKVGTS